MRLSQQRVEALNTLCNTLRKDVLSVLHKVQTGHPGGSVSVCEILVSLYFEKTNIDGAKPNDPARDRVVLCKGHAAPMLYRILAEKGFFPVEEMQNLRQFGSHLQGHPCALHTPGIEVSTGPLGAGFPAALGIALGNRMSGIDSTTYAILGDGESNEGVVWETAMSAYKFKADNLIAILDWNKVQLDGTMDQIMPMPNMKERWESFGWHAIECDGHDVAAICEAIDAAKAEKGRPSILLCHTLKGKGVSFMEGKNKYHGAPLSAEELSGALEELGGAFDE